MTEPTPVAAETPMVPAGTDSPLPRHRDVVSDVVSDDDWDGDDSFLADGPQQPESVDEHLDLSVAAVVVAHDGMEWLPIVVAAIRGQERPVQRLIVVDTGSRDGGPELLARELPATDVVTMPRTTSFADAVTAGVARAGAHDFIWLLHDDSAPRTDALLYLLDAAVRSGAAVIGPKVLGWSDRTHLLEIGVSIGLGGRRETGLERGERDQGQHDRDADVLAVGSAGMLVRSEVWHGLDGFDGQFPLFREDVDFGWRANAAGYRVTIAPRAVVHHAEAATRGLRRADAVGGHPQRADRLHAMRIVLANCTTWQLPLVTVGLVLLCIVRTLTLLVGKDVKSAREEAQALRLLVTHPGLVRDARAARSAARIVPAAEVAPLIAPPWAPLRTAIDAVSALVGSSGAGTERPSVVVETGPGSDDAMEALVDGGPSVVGRLMRRRGSIVLAFLLTLSLLAGRGIIGAGRAQGGALLPAPGGFADLWSSFLAAWHPVSVGSSLPASPATALLAALSIAFAGSASAVVDALLILAVPMSFVSAHLSMRGVVRNPWVKIWASLSYALIPALTVSVRDGRVGTVVLAVLFPPLVRAAVHLIGKGAAPAGDRAPWATGLLLAAAGAFAPIVWLVAAVCAVVAGMTIIRDKATRLAMVIALAVPLVVWVPWSFTLLTHPQQFLLEAGVPAGGPPPVALSPWSVLGLSAGGAGAAWWGLTAGLLLAAVLALASRARRALLMVLWSIGGGLLVAAVVLARTSVPSINSGPVPLWSGPLVVMAAALLLSAAAVGNESVVNRLSARAFSLRQLAVVAVAGLALLAPVTSALVWLRDGADGPVQKTTDSQVPAFVALAAQGPAQPRTLVLRSTAGRIDYSLVRGGRLQWGDAEVSPPLSSVRGLDAVVSDLAAGRGGIEAQRLAAYAIGYVLVRAPVPVDLARQLTAAPGLVKAAAPDGSALWQVTQTTARVRLVGPRGVVRVVPSSGLSASLPLPRAWPGGTLVIAESADPGWKATVNGKPLKPAVVDKWAQGFAVPAASSGRLDVSYRSAARGGWLVLAFIAVIVVIVLALPARRRTDLGSSA